MPQKKIVKNVDEQIARFRSNVEALDEKLDKLLKKKKSMNEDVDGDEE